MPLEGFFKISACCITTNFYKREHDHFTPCVLSRTRVRDTVTKLLFIIGVVPGLLHICDESGHTGSVIQQCGF
jgi:hypothetical protein